MSGLPFGVGGLIFVVSYLAFMVALGFYAKRRKHDDSLGDFYLAGRSLGPLVLLLTLYATQYSGNSVLGYPAEGYRLGFAWLMSVSFMMSIVVAYLAFAPGLRRLAVEHGFITPGDFLDHRFGSKSLSLLANLLLVISIANYLLAQLMAMGHVTAGLSGQLVPNWVGVLILVVVIILYETLGGLRAVAWTDCVQGVMLLVGILALFYSIAPSPSDWAALTDWLNRNAPEKTAVPSTDLCLRWVGTIVLIGFSGAVYPQAIQRIYAARSTKALKRSLQLLVFMPLVTTSIVLIVGLDGIRRFPGLSGIEADQIMPLLLREWAQESSFSYVMALLVVTGTLAAIMSTADSVLLSLSSILAKDVLGKALFPGTSEKKLTTAGKLISWLIMGVLAVVAFSPRITLWGLIELKMEILIQVSPLFVLGVTWPRFHTRAALTGLTVGSLAAAWFVLTGVGSIGGLPAGVTAWGLNVLCGVGLSLLTPGERNPIPSPASSC